jgi:hypothetical protein
MSLPHDETNFGIGTLGELDAPFAAGQAASSKANDLFHRCLAFSNFFTANRRFAATARKLSRGMQDLARREPDFSDACRRPDFSVRS